MSLRTGLALSGMDPYELWLRNVALGRVLTRLEPLDAVTDHDEVGPRIRNAVAAALNEGVTEFGLSGLFREYATT